MKLYKFFMIVLTLVMGIGMIGCSSNETKDEVSIGIVLGDGGVNDQSFNQSTWEGLQKAKEEFGVAIQFLESKNEGDYITNIENLIDGDTDLIIGVGYQLKNAIEESAKNYPDQKFAILDETYENIQPNVIPVVFNENESAYLVGAISAKMSESKKVGFIGGLPAPAVVRYQYGFKAGVESAGAQVLEQYANTFVDQAKGKAIAQQMHTSGVDVIFSAAGDTGTGAIEAAKENGKYAVGGDKDQSYLAKENVITSALKRLDVASYTLAKELVEGKFEGGKEKVYGLKEGGVGISETTKNLVPQEIIDYANEQAGKIIKGEIVVPKSEEEYNKLSK